MKKTIYPVWSNGIYAPVHYTCSDENVLVAEFAQCIDDELEVCDRRYVQTARINFSLEESLDMVATGCGGKK